MSRVGVDVNAGIDADAQQRERETIELIRVYKKGIDWQNVYQAAVNESNDIYEKKLNDALASGMSEKRLSAIRGSWEDMLASNPKLIKLRKASETIQKPSVEQKRISEEAANRLVVLHEPLVGFIIQKRFGAYANSQEFDDALNAGRIGLFRSFRDYDPDKGAFSTYAAIFIESAICDHISWFYGSSSHYHRRAKLYKKAVAKLQSEGVVEPDMAEIALEMNAKPSAIRRLLYIMANARMDSLEDIADGIDSVECETGLSRLIDPFRLDPEKMVVRNELREIITEALDTLPRDQRLVIDMLYMDSDKPYGYRAIWDELVKLKTPGSIERNPKHTYIDGKVRHIKISALRSLRNSLSKYECA